jgi:hypothetical protein
VKGIKVVTTEEHRTATRAGKEDGSREGGRDDREMQSRESRERERESQLETFLLENILTVRITCPAGAGWAGKGLLS